MGNELSAPWAVTARQQGASGHGGEHLYLLRSWAAQDIGTVSATVSFQNDKLSADALNETGRNVAQALAEILNKFSTTKKQLKAFVEGGGSLAGDEQQQQQQGCDELEKQIKATKSLLKGAKTASIAIQAKLTHPEKLSEEEKGHLKGALSKVLGEIPWASQVVPAVTALLSRVRLCVTVQE